MHSQIWSTLVTKQLNYLDCCLPLNPHYRKNCMNNKIQEQYQDDETDLRELISALRGNKLLILAITAIFAITGMTYAFLAPQVWSAKAIVAAPLPTQFEELQLRLARIQLIIDIDNNNSITKNVSITINNLNTANKPIISMNRTDLSGVFSGKILINDFIMAFDSFDNKVEFLNKTVSAQEDDMNKRGNLQRSLGNMAISFSVKEDTNGTKKTLLYSGDNAQEVWKLLNEYLNFIQTKEITAKNKLIDDIISNRIKFLSLSYNLHEALAFKRLREEIIRTEFSLRVCKAADLKDPVENLNSQSIFNLGFGAKALKEKLIVLKDMKYPELIDPKLAEISLQLDNLQALPRGKVSFKSYRLQQPPSEPLKKDKPKQFILVVLATMLGLMTGVLAAWFRAKFPLESSRED